MNIDITNDEIEAIRISSEWGVIDGSWAHKQLVKLYTRIVEIQEKQYRDKKIYEKAE